MRECAGAGQRTRYSAQELLLRIRVRCSKAQPASVIAQSRCQELGVRSVASLLRAVSYRKQLRAVLPRRRSSIIASQCG